MSTLMLSQLQHGLSTPYYHVYLEGTLVYDMELIDGLVRIITVDRLEYFIPEQDLEPALRAKPNAMSYTVECQDGGKLSIRVSEEITAHEDEFLLRFCKTTP